MLKMPLTFSNIMAFSLELLTNLQNPTKIMCGLILMLIGIHLGKKWCNGLERTKTELSGNLVRYEIYLPCNCQIERSKIFKCCN